MHAVAELFDPARHEPLQDAAWDADVARAAIVRIGAAAEQAFDPVQGNWPAHPQDDPPQPDARSFNFYWGAAGVAWALRWLAARGAVTPVRGYETWIERYPDLVREETAHELHGSASYLFGESAPLLLAWQVAPSAALAERLHALVEGNLHNTANEPLWGNAGSLLAAIAMAEAHAAGPERQRWQALVSRGVEALLHDLQPEAESGTWIWEQDLYGKRCRYLGAGHGLAGNAYAATRAAGLVDAARVRAVEQRACQALVATALHARLETAAGQVGLANWNVLVDAGLIATWRAQGRRPLVQDCHGAPGIVCRMAGVADMPAELLQAAGELTWLAGPLSKGPSLCHGTAGSAMACLKLWQRLGDERWLARARRLALHAAAQVETARERYGQGRHSLWTGDLGVALTLWHCIEAQARFPTLDHF